VLLEDALLMCVASVYVVGITGPYEDTVRTLLLIEELIAVASVYVVAEVELGVAVGVTTVSHHEGELL
jgi:hypothetical protein